MFKDTYFNYIRYNVVKITIIHRISGIEIRGLKPLFDLGDAYFEETWQVGEYARARRRNPPNFPMPVVAPQHNESVPTQMG